MSKPILKLFVENNALCMELLEYIHSAIDGIKQTGCKLRVEKITDDDLQDGMFETLRKRGITRMPALLDPNNKITVGKQSIINILKSNIVKAKNEERVPRKNNFNSGNDVTNYLHQQIFAGVNSESNGKFKMDDEDDGMNEEIDFGRKMAEARAREPAHRRSDQRELDIESSNKNPPRSKLKAKKSIKQEIDDDDQTDNVNDNFYVQTESGMDEMNNDILKAMLMEDV